jgi:hypothetical protein
MTVFAAGLIFISWFVEYLFNDINFVDWVIKRWYVHLGILSVALVICIETVVHANVTWRQLCALSSPLNDTAAKSRASHATAGVVFGENLVARYATSVFSLEQVRENCCSRAILRLLARRY